jgi:2'-5' RNA ligase
MMLRLFVGVPLSAAHQEGLERIRRVWSRRFRSKLSWTKTGNWHLTLKFLGDAPAERLEAIKSALATVRFAPFVLQPAGGGFFPPAGGREPRPRVLWVGLGQGAPACVSLARQVDEAMQGLGFPAETRPLAAHLTLARVKDAQPDAWLEFVKDLEETSWPPTTVDRIVLWRSELGPGGPKYSSMFELLSSS